MGAINGIGGAINGIDSVRNWHISSKADLARFAASNTAGAVGADIGNDDWSGSYAAYGGTPILMPAETGTFTGSIDGSIGVAGPIIVDSVDIAWDIEGGKPLAHAVNFSANGVLTPGTAVAADEVVPAPLSSILCLAKWDSDEIPDIRTMNLRISAANVPYVNSSTAGHTYRKPGNITLDASISVHADDLTDLLELNDTAVLSLYTTAALYWEITWAMVSDIADIVMDREAAAMVGATMSFAHVISQSAVMGTIKKPGGSTWWPAS